MVENIAKLISFFLVNIEKILVSQSSSHSQLDIVIKQLVTQQDQTSTLISTIAKTDLVKPYTPPLPPPSHPPYVHSHQIPQNHVVIFQRFRAFVLAIPINT